MKNNVIVLQIYTTADLEYVRDSLATVLRETKRWCKWVQQHRLQSFVIITWETPLDLRKRLDAFIVDKPGFGGVYCFTAPDDLVGLYGEWEALRFHIDAARVEARERDKANDLSYRERRNRWPKR